MLEGGVGGGAKLVVLRKNRVECHCQCFSELVQDRKIFCEKSETLAVADRDDLEVMRRVVGRIFGVSMHKGVRIGEGEVPLVFEDVRIFV